MGLVRRAVGTGLLAAGLSAGPAAPAGAGWIQQTRGHLVAGYARAVLDQAPGGSASFGAGLDYPLRRDLALGVQLDYHLLGSGRQTSGILEAQLDYSLFGALAALHWNPESLPGLHHLSLLAGLYHARADLTAAPGGSTFIDAGVSEAAPGGGVGATFMSSRPGPLRLGLELTGQIVVLPEDDWGLWTARLAVHY